jgi:rubrerythrin
VKHLGNLAAVPESSLYLRCNHCQVSWGGCAAVADCPECGAPKDYLSGGECLCEMCVPNAALREGTR